MKHIRVVAHAHTLVGSRAYARIHNANKEHTHKAEAILVWKTKGLWQREFKICAAEGTHARTHSHTHTQGIQLSRDKWTCTCAVSPLDCRSVSVSGHFPGHCFFRLLAPMKRCSAGLTLGRHQTLAIIVGPRTLPELGHLWPRGWPQPHAGPTLHRIKNVTMAGGGGGGVFGRTEVLWMNEWLILLNVQRGDVAY